MKQLAILILCLVSVNLLAQDPIEKEVQTDVNEVTVFIEGAQVTRKKAVDLIQGTTILKFTNLSPFIDPKSIKVKSEGDVMVLAVNHQQNFLEKIEKPVELTYLEEKYKELDENIQLQNTYIAIVGEELLFLQDNRIIGGKDQEVNVANLKEASAFYDTKLTALKLREIELYKTIDKLTLEQNDIANQIKTLTSKKEYATGEILVKVETKRSVKAAFEVSYLVKNASWFPTYDIRAKNISEPIQLMYKANVRQDTKEEWKNVKLRFSSTNPNRTGSAPELKTYLLNYYSAPPTYSQTDNSVTGRVFDETGEPMTGVSVRIKGTTIGAVTDIDGNYSITIPKDGTELEFLYIGYMAESVSISGPVMNFVMTPDVQTLDEVVVIGYGTQYSEDIAGSSYDSYPSTKKYKESAAKTELKRSLSINSVQIERQTTVDFEIKVPYTVLSDNKNYTVDMEMYELPAFYQYYCVPKIDKDAFLVAQIIDWEQYNLIEGEANIFFEDTYVGKTLLDVRFAADTLNISLGRDKNVSVNREKMKDFTNRQFIGSKQEETRGWKIMVKNNKSQAISMVLLDQVPVSTLEEIEVEIQNISGAKQDIETGEIKWEFSLDPGIKKDFDLQYSVKFPKYRNLIIE